MSDHPKPFPTNNDRCLTDVDTDPAVKIRFMYRQRQSGRKVAFMETECLDDSVDSGWRFISGADRDCVPIVIYRVNLIAKWHPEIIPFLNAPIPSAFERHPETGEFIEVRDYLPPKSLFD